MGRAARQLAQHRGLGYPFGEAWQSPGEPMIPIRDTIRSRTFPLVNTLIIAANVLVFFWTRGPVLLVSSHR